MNNNSKKINSNTYKLLFEAPEEESEKIDSLRYNLLFGTQHTKEDLKKVKKDIKFLYGYEKDYFAYKEIDDNIQYLTSKAFRNEKQKHIEKIKEHNDVVKNVVQNGENSYIIDTIDGQISFSTIDELATEKTELLVASNDEEGIRNYFRDISNFETRLHRCHRLGVYAAHILDEFLGIKNQMVTGYTCFATEKSKYLHTWNEFKMGEKEYVLDSTLNVIMNKDGYYLLRHIEEVLDKIDSDKVIEDFEKYGDEITKYSIKAYVTARDLLIKDFEKNLNNEEER